MAFANASVEVRGAKRIGRWIDRWAKLSGDPRPLLKLYGLKMIAITNETWKRQADPKTGRRWKPTSALTVGARPRARGGAKTLTNTALLRRSLSTFQVIGKTAVRQRTNRPGAATHMRGATIRPVHALNLWIPKTRLASRLVGGGSASGGTGGGVRRAIRRLREMGENPRDHFVVTKLARVPQRRYLGFSRRHTGELVAIGANAYRMLRKTNRVPKRLRDAGGGFA